ncbi:MAG: GTP 3',8-cyclase MoaA [Pseudomonadota bacterium]|nr:GTP 3',8-cyclase MoaA [Pseudomonadota bacterium]
MYDNYHRDINYLRVSITDRCNLRCRYCIPKEGLSLLGHDDILRYEEILRVVRVAVGLGVAKVRVTGGEPLVRRGVIPFMTALKLLPGIEDLSLTTNGVLLERYAADLRAAGVCRLNISLDSLNREKYHYITRGGSLADALRGIDAVFARGFAPIKINVVAMKGFNDDEILDFARLTLERPFQVRFIELMPVGHTGRDNIGKYLACEEIRGEIARNHPLLPVPGARDRMDGPARIYRIDGGVGEIGFIAAMSNHFCHRCNRLRLTADGHLRSCLFSDAEIDLKDPLRSGCSDDRIASLIREAIAKKPRKHKIRPEGNYLGECGKNMSAIGG